MAGFLALLAAGLAAAPASALSYALGIGVHWLISSRAVFVSGVAARGPARTRQKALFVASALVGLALTAGIVGLGAALGLDPRLAKIVAVGVSFAVQVMPPSADDTEDSVPLAIVRSALVKLSTASEKVIVTAEVSPTINEVSVTLMVAVGRSVSMV